MSREIKFRAWEKEEKEYYYNVEYTYDFFCSGRGCYAESFGGVLDQPDRFVVEQYTGLKDKNGKEVYEGDVVKVIKAKKFNGDGELVATRKKTMGVYIVLFDELNGEYVFCERNDLDTPEIGGFPYWAEYEVIGNIHENPELLKGENE